MVTMSGDVLAVAAVADLPEGQHFAFFVLQDCRLDVVITSDEVVPEIWIGGGRTNDVWFSCQSDQVSMVQLATSNPDAEPMNYGAGVAQTYNYADGVFTWTGSSDLDVALPATYEEMTGLFPPCVG